MMYWGCVEIGCKNRHTTSSSYKDRASTLQVRSMLSPASYIKLLNLMRFTISRLDDVQVGMQSTSIVYITLSLTDKIVSLYIVSKRIA